MFRAAKIAWTLGLTSTIATTGQVADPLSTVSFRLADGVLITVADPVDGLIVWLDREAGTDGLEFEARFNPVTVDRWLQTVRPVFRSADQHEGSFASMPLNDLDQGGLVVRRVGADAILAYQSHPDSNLLGVRLDSETLGSILAEWDTLAAVAHWSPVAEVNSGRARFGALAVDSVPDRLGGPSPQYPERLRRRGIQGSAWSMFVVDSSGAVPLQTIYVLYADEPAFADAALRVLANSMYRPALVAGRAVPFRAFQRISFTIRRDE